MSGFDVRRQRQWHEAYLSFRMMSGVIFQLQLMNEGYQCIYETYGNIVNNQGDSFVNVYFNY